MQRHITEFLGPIFAKEILEIARRWRYYLCRTVYAVTLLVVMLIAWEEYQAFAGRAGMGNSLARFAGIVFTATSFIQYWAVYLLVPAFLGGVVAGEREEHTLDLLFITPLSDREIVLGKLFSRVAAMVCMILCGIPVLSFIMLFGGVAPESIWRLLAATLLATFFAGSHAIYFSVIGRGPMEALTRTYIAFFMWLAGLPLLAWAFRELCQHTLGGIPPVLIEYFSPLMLIYPLVSFWGAYDESYYTTMSFLYGSWAWPLSFVPPALWSVFLSWRAIRRLRQLPRPRANWTRWLPWAGKARQRSARPEAIAAHRARAHVTWLGHVVANPLWLRSRLTHVYDRAGAIRRLQWLGWTIVVVALVLIGIFEPKNQGSPFTDGYAVAFLTPVWGAFMLVAALVSGHSLIGDRRRGFLELVAGTPLTGQEVVDGTMLALWEHLRRLLWLPWMVSLFFCVLGATPIGHWLFSLDWQSSTPSDISIAGVLVSLITGTLFCSLLVCQGIACSLASQTTPGAVVGSFVLPLAVVFVMPMVAMGYREYHALALWTICGLWFLVTSVAAWWRLNGMSVACCLTGLHLVLIALAECWTLSSRRDDQYPMAAMHPIFLIVAPLANYGRNGYRDVWTNNWVGIEMCYWAALIVNIVLIRWWLAWNFNRLVGRTDDQAPRRRAEPKSSTIAPREQLSTDPL